LAVLVAMSISMAMGAQIRSLVRGRKVCYSKSTHTFLFLLSVLKSTEFLKGGTHVHGKQAVLQHDKAYHENHAHPWPKMLRG